MGIFASASRFITTTFDTGTNTVSTVGKTLDMVNHWVDQQHKRVTKSTTTSAQLSLAQFNADVAEQLASSAELNTQFDEVVLAWDETPEQTKARHAAAASK